MCGRFALSSKVNEQITEFVEKTGRAPQDWKPGWEEQSDYNVAPTSRIPVLLDFSKTRELMLEPARWSLVPAWSDSLKLKFPTFNARAENILTKNTWRKPVQHHRCIIPSSGFYEWTGERGSKQPWFIHDPNDEILGFAGLYSWWPDRSLPENDPERWVLTATVLTSDAVQTLAGIHDRNPVILPQGLWSQWIDPSIVGDQALVDEAVSAGVAEASNLVFDPVKPFGLSQHGPELTEPIDLDGEGPPENPRST